MKKQKKLKLFHDKIGNTLTVWFDDPQSEYIAEEIGDDTIVMKNKKGIVIGLEKLNYIVPFQKDSAELPIEIVSQ